MARISVLLKYADVFWNPKFQQYCWLKNGIFTWRVFFPLSSFQVLLRELWPSLFIFYIHFEYLYLGVCFSQAEKLEIFQVYLVIIPIFWHYWYDCKYICAERQFFQLTDNVGGLWTPWGFQNLLCLGIEELMCLQLYVSCCSKGLLLSRNTVGFYLFAWWHRETLAEFKRLFSLFEMLKSGHSLQFVFGHLLHILHENANWNRCGRISIRASSMWRFVERQVLHRSPGSSSESTRLCLVVAPGCQAALNSEPAATWMSGPGVLSLSYKCWATWEIILS